MLGSALFLKEKASCLVFGIQGSEAPFPLDSSDGVRLSRREFMTFHEGPVLGLTILCALVLRVIEWETEAVTDPGFRTSLFAVPQFPPRNLLSTGSGKPIQENT